MSFLGTLTPRQFNAACDLDMSEPVPLAQADLQRPFVYDRAVGVIYAPFGRHQGVMSLLLAIRHHLPSGPDVATKLGLRESGDTADYWLEHTPGAAFKSSVSGRIKVGSGRGLTPLERRLFGDVEALFPPTPQERHSR